MKNIIYLALIFGLMAACSGNREDGKQSGETPLQTENIPTDPDLEGEILNDSGFNQDSSDNQLQINKPPGEVDIEEYNRLRGTSEFHFKRGLVLYKINNFKEGILEFDTVISISPNLGSAYLNRGKGLLQIEDYQRAKWDFQKAVELDRSDTLAYLQLALAHYHLGDLESCIRVNNELIQLSPKSAVGYFNRGTAYGKQNNFPKAIADFSKAVEIDPNYTDAHFNLGLAYYWSGDQAKACQNWAKARNLGSEKAARVIETYCQ
jgi:tetratricopeptide (TPR) repeat protein